jgi:gluconate 2-dehydrogenase gamma chain
MSGQELTVQMLRRREVLKRAAMLLGGAISAPAILGVLQGCADRKEEPATGEAPAKPWAPKFFTATQLAVIAEIAEIILPKTDTAGARDALVPQFIDSMLADVYPVDDQERFRAGLAKFEADAAAASDAGGKSFLDQAADRRVTVVKASLSAELDGERHPKPFMLMTRELTLLGFFNSRVGVEQFTDYQPVPQKYHGCVPLQTMKKHVEWEP